jgi:hypothetical protein
MEKKTKRGLNVAAKGKQKRRKLGISRKAR